MCLDYRYLHHEMNRETKEDVKTAKNQAEANVSRHSTVMGYLQSKKKKNLLVE